MDGDGLPEAGEVPAWHAPLRGLTRRTTAAWRDRGWSWTTGGCFAFAEAFKAAFGGDEFGICSRDAAEGDYPVEHAVVRVGDDFFDYSGRLDIEAEMAALTARTGREMFLKRRDDDGVFWFEDDFLDDKDMARLHDVLAACAPSRAPSP